jgi:hypothetical protein
MQIGSLHLGSFASHFTFEIHKISFFLIINYCIKFQCINILQLFIHSTLDIPVCVWFWTIIIVLQWKIFCISFGILMHASKTFLISKLCINKEPLVSYSFSIYGFYVCFWVTFVFGQRNLDGGQMTDRFWAFSTSFLISFGSSQQGIFSQWKGKSVIEKTQIHMLSLHSRHVY